MPYKVEDAPPRRPSLTGRKEWLTSVEAGHLLGMTPGRVTLLLRTQRIRGERRPHGDLNRYGKPYGGEGNWMISRAEVESFAQKTRMPSGGTVTIYDVMGLLGLHERDVRQWLHKHGVSRHKDIRVGYLYRYNKSEFDAALQRLEAQVPLPRSPRVLRVLNLVAESAGMPPWVVLARIRSVSIGGAMAVLAVLLYEELGMGVKAIGQELCRNHATILHHIEHRGKWTYEQREMYATCRDALRTRKSA